MAVWYKGKVEHYLRLGMRSPPVKECAKEKQRHIYSQFEEVAI